MNLPNIKIVSGPHSSEKNHTLMTGGTLTVDKHITSNKPLTIVHYILPGITEGITDLYKGLHTLEHMLAYTPTTGGLRTQLAEVTGNDYMTKFTIDISPYFIGKNHFGFRITSLVSIDIKDLEEAYKKSLLIGEAYINSGGKPPFATPLQCGQYDFHSNNAALIIIKSAQRIMKNKSFQIVDTGYTGHLAESIDICDLRLIKPKSEGNHKQRMLIPESSHFISSFLEKNVHLGLSGGKLGDIRLGTFGCMTGDYAIISNHNTVEAHVAISRCLLTLINLPKVNYPKAIIRDDSSFCLEYIHKYSPEVYARAIELGPIDLMAPAGFV